MKNSNLSAHNEKADALLFLDLSNIICSASELNSRIDFKKLIYNLSQRFNLKGLFVFTNFNQNKKFIEMLYNLGFIVYPVPSDADAYMGFKIGELVSIYNPTVVIIGTHDGDFRWICDELEQTSIMVYFIGFKDKFSSFLKRKPCLCLEDFHDVLSSNIQPLPKIT